jgi:hypothetical protein
MERERLAPMHHEVVVDGELDLVRAGQQQPARVAQTVDARPGRRGVDRLGVATLEPEDHGLGAAVPVPGRAQ